MSAGEISSIQPVSGMEAKIATETIRLFAPDTPLSLNDSPYGLSVDPELLVQAVNVIKNDRAGLTGIYPSEVHVGLNNEPSVVKLGHNGHIFFTDIIPRKRPTFTGTDKNSGAVSLGITIPKVVSSSEYNPEGLAQAIESQANTDLLLAFSGVLDARRKFNFTRRRAGIALAAIAGNTAGLALDSQLYTGLNQTIRYGLCGAIAGPALYLGGLLAADSSRWEIKKQYSGREDYAVKKTSVPTQISNDFLELSEKATSGKGIISINPLPQ